MSNEDNKYATININRNEPRVWLTSDKHLNHSKILTFCNRPFNSINHHDSAIISNHNAVVEPRDIVIDLGDFCFADEFEMVEDYFSRLNGNIIFVKGNHDRFTDTKYRDLIKKGALMQFHNTGTLFFRHNGEKYHMSHYPCLDWDGRWKGRPHFFGHVHLGPKSMSLANVLSIQYNSYDVGADNNQYAPILLEDAIKKAKIKYSPKKMDHELIQTIMGG